MAFPTLSRPPSFPIDPDGSLEDGVLRTTAEAGYVETRPRFTRARRSWGLNYPNLPDADTVTLRSWELTTLRNGADSFDWTHPLTAATYTVQLGPGLIKYKKAKKGNGEDVSMTLVEV
jgi:hypothetical protein